MVNSKESLAQGCAHSLTYVLLTTKVGKFIIRTNKMSDFLCDSPVYCGKSAKLADEKMNITDMIMKKVIFTEKAPAAIGPYSQAVEANGMVFLSGQLPVDPATGNIVDGGAKEQTARIFENIKNVLAEAGLTTANIVKTTVFLADMSLFGDMNEVYARYFEGDFPARSAVAVKALPKGASVEIECIAVR